MNIQFLFGKIKLGLMKLVKSNAEAEKTIMLTHPDMVISAKLVLMTATGEEITFDVDTMDMKEIQWEAILDEDEAMMSEEELREMTTV
jgi:hypothetical protein